MLIIDEIHSILAGTFREQRILLNAIRFLANDLRIPIVCVGTYDAKQALMTDQQLADRFEAMESAPWEDDATFQQLLCSFGAMLPLRKSSNLIDGCVATLELKRSLAIACAKLDYRRAKQTKNEAMEKTGPGRRCASRGLTFADHMNRFITGDRAPGSPE
jgi:hypothetical protein